jgi:hypothetical protein
MRLLIVAVAGMALAACGGGSSASSRAAATTTTTAMVAAHPLTGPQLQALVVVAPPPFVRLPDSVLKTGLMEVGNPNAGQIGLPFTNEQQLVRMGFHRGWETIYRAPDKAIIDINVFEFTAASGPTAITRQYLAHPQAGYRRHLLQGVPGATVEIGTSPEGRTAAATAFAHGRFFVVLTVGGGPNLHDYQGLINQLAQQQLAKLR